MNRKRSIWSALCVVLTLCLLLGTMPVCATEVTDVTEEPEEKPATVEVVVAIADVPQGTRLSDRHVKTITVPNYNIPKNVQTNILDVCDRYAAVDLLEGEYVYLEQTSKNKVTKFHSDTIIQPITESKDDYVIVTDYILADTGKDLAGPLQQLINENPARTLYFPDGVYEVSTTLKTSADGKTSVSLQLSDGAVIKASDKWQKSSDLNNAIIALGAARPANNIRIAGSYYSLMGGTLDCNGKANGISISSGRETLTRNICIKNPREIGIYVDTGANGNGITGSSDNDFEDITIIGDGGLNTIGIKLIGYDNSITNVRIYNCERGIDDHSAGNLVKSIYIYNDPSKIRLYSQSIGIYNTDGTDNWYSDCYVENCAIAYRMGRRTITYDCVARWTSDLCTTQTAVAATHPNLAISGFKAYFHGEESHNCFLKLNDTNNKRGIVEGCMFDESLVDDKTYQDFLITPVIPVQ